jgi:hypothetical protein
MKKFRTLFKKSETSPSIFQSSASYTTDCLLIMLWFNLPSAIYRQIYICTFIVFRIISQTFCLSSLLFFPANHYTITYATFLPNVHYLYCSWLRISVCHLWLLVEFLSTSVPVKPAVFLNNPHIHEKIRASFGYANILLHTSEPPGIPQIERETRGYFVTGKTLV